MAGWKNPDCIVIKYLNLAASYFRGRRLYDSWLNLGAWVAFNAAVGVGGCAVGVGWFNRENVLQDKSNAAAIRNVMYFTG
jgi:hypothetical protein